MTPDIFSEWLRLRGHEVIQTESAYWFDVAPHIYQSFPYHELMQPTNEELNHLLQDENAIALRYSTPINGNMGAISYHVVLDNTEYCLEDLSKRARYDVRKALKAGFMQAVSFDRMAEEGWPLRLDTLQRQGRKNIETKAWWQELCHAAEDLPGFEAWSIVIEGKMAAALIAFTCGETCSILYQQSSTEHLSLGVNNALAFEFSREALSRPDTKRIFYGLHSLDAPASVDDFKFRMSFVALPVRQRVVFHSALAPFINGATYAFMRGLLRLFPNIESLSKAEGILRFYRQGKRPLNDQDWPPPLKELREQLSSGSEKTLFFKASQRGEHIA